MILTMNKTQNQKIKKNQIDTLPFIRYLQLIYSFLNESKKMIYGNNCNVNRGDKNDNFFFRILIFTS